MLGTLSLKFTPKTMSSLSRYFGHYWESRTFGWHKVRYEGELWEHTASNLFRLREVESGDVLYGWSFMGGTLFLIARMRVGRFISQADADALYVGDGSGAWEADDHVLAAPGSATAMRFARPLPDHLARELTFLSPSGDIKSPVVNRSGNLDPQTFRGVRELTNSSAAILDDIISQNA